MTISFILLLNVGLNCWGVVLKQMKFFIGNTQSGKNLKVHGEQGKLRKTSMFFSQCNTVLS